MDVLDEVIEQQVQKESKLLDEKVDEILKYTAESGKKYKGTPAFNREHNEEAGPDGPISQNVG